MIESAGCFARRESLKRAGEAREKVRCWERRCVSEVKSVLDLPTRGVSHGLSLARKKMASAMLAVAASPFASTQRDYDIWDVLP